MKKPKKPWRRGSRLGPGLIDLSDGTLPAPQYAWNCCLCDEHRPEPNTFVGAKPLPGVSRHNEPAICPSCLDEHGAGAYCAGCDKPLIDYDRETESAGLPDGSSWKAELEIGGKFEVFVCGDGEWSSHSTTPMLQCKRKARRALALCPGGCGGAADPGELCEDCYYRIVDAKRMEKADPTHRCEIRVPRELAEIVGRAVSGRGSGKAHVTEYGDVSAYVTPTQAAAMKELADVFEAFGKRKHAEGFAEGDTFLTRLAKGSISMDELNKRSLS